MTTTHTHTPAARETYAPGDRVHFLGTRRGTVTSTTHNPTGLTSILLDGGGKLRVYAHALRPVALVSNVPTSELRPGDIVYTGAGTVRLGEPLATYRDDVHAFDGRVLALDERIAAGSDTARWVRSVNRGGHDIPDDDWTVQGNDLARWTIEARP